ncbi:MAG: response regulator [Enhygromyxa sp.]
MPRSPTSAPLRILLVEDDQIDVENVRRTFAKTGASVQITVACDGERALELLTAGQIPLDKCLILLDLNMPRMNGIEFLRALRGDPAFDHVPVVVLTTSDAEPDRVGACDLNVTGYMLKPVSFDDFVTALDAAETYWRLRELS